MLAAVFLTCLCFTLSASFPSHYFIQFPSAQELLTRPSGRPFTISVEGNVGAGKSTLLKYFDKYAEVSTFTEPLDTWQDLNGTNFLGLTYRDPERWGMTFESLVTLTMAQVHTANTLDTPETYTPVKVMERSIHSARACFIENLAPMMTKGEVSVLDSWYRFFAGEETQHVDVGVDLVIYLRTSPEIAMSRVQSRNRSEELELGLEFFSRMHELHEDWLIKRSSVSGVASPAQVLIIDANQDLSILTNTYENLANNIWSMIPEELRIREEF